MMLGTGQKAKRMVLEGIASMTGRLLDAFLWLWPTQLHSRPIFWTEDWCPEGHNNIRYASLLPRLRLVHPHYRVRGLLTVHRKDFLGRLRSFWTLRIAHPFELRWRARRHRALLCTSDFLDQIARFPGPVFVDDDDPEFTEERAELLNQDNVVCVVTTSGLLRNRLMEVGLKKTCHVIPSGVAFDTLSVERARRIGANLGKSGSALVVGYSIPDIYTDLDDPNPTEAGVFSSTHRLRSVSFLFRAMEKLRRLAPEVELWLIGKPSESVRAYARENPYCRLLGYVPHSELLNYTWNFDIAVYPRVADVGGRHSIKLLEFLGCGVPVVSTNVSESYLVSQAEAGIVTDGLEGFSTALLQLVREPELRRQLGANGRNFAQSYSWENLARRYEKEIFEPYLERLEGRGPDLGKDGSVPDKC